MSIFNTIICRYNEIATKGHNRSMFENRLLENIRYFCSGICDIKASRIRGRIFLYKTDRSEFTDEESNRISDALKRCFGLDSFSFCLEGKPDMEEVKEMVRKSAPFYFEQKMAAGPVKFRSRARRSDKSFPLDSKGIEIEIATLIDAMYGDRICVDLEQPDISIGIEMREQTAIVYYETIKAPGGLPTGSNSPVLALLSGGIDSPVACNMMMKRGCHVDYLTFHSFPYTPMESVEKVARLAAVLNRWQKAGNLYACNISEIQKLIRDHCTPKFRTVLYRRMMMRIAGMLCSRNNLAAIVTGEAAGQVASQTIENMSVIDRSTDYLILRPLCGMDKNETIERAVAMDTFNISIEPMADSCTVFAPDSPVLHAKLHTAEWEESKIPDLEDALQKAFESIEKVEIPEMV